MFVSVENPYLHTPKFDSGCLPTVVSRGLEAMVGRADAQETALFARQIEYIYTQTYDIKYPDLKARSLIPVDTRVPSGADTFTYTQYDKIGQAGIVHSYAEDFPNAEVKGKQFRQGAFSLGASYQYSIQDMRAAAMAGVPLEAKKAEAARYAIEKKLEKLAATGDAGTGMTGLANAPNLTGTTKVSQNNAGSTSATWASLISDALAKGNMTAAAQEILKDFSAMSQQVHNQSDGVFEADTVVVPTKSYSLLATTYVAPQFGNPTSLLKFILEASPWLKEIEFWPYLDTAASLQGGTSGAHGLVMAYKKDPAVLSLIIPQEFEQFAPQPRNMSFIVPCHMRTGAVTVRYPIGVTFMINTD